jgi:hypothetical protein
MGYNTTVIVLNDALGNIEEDPEFGYNLARAIMRLGVPHGNRPVDVSSKGHCNAASAIETHHADRYIATAIGGNTAIVLGDCGSWQVNDEVDMLRRLADKHGYNLHKKREYRS